MLDAAEPDGAPVVETVVRYCGRFATLFGVEDVVRLGRRLLVVDPAADDPAAAYVALEPDGPHTFRVVRTPGTARRTLPAMRATGRRFDGLGGVG